MPERPSKLHTLTFPRTQGTLGLTEVLRNCFRIRYSRFNRLSHQGDLHLLTPDFSPSRNVLRAAFRTVRKGEARLIPFSVFNPHVCVSMQARPVARWGLCRIHRKTLNPSSGWLPRCDTTRLRVGVGESISGLALHFFRARVHGAQRPSSSFAQARMLRRNR